MLNLIIAIRGTVDDENEAHRILTYIDDVLDLHPEDELKATCQCSQQITNDPISEPP